MVARKDLEGAHIPRKPVKNGFQRRQFQRGERRLRGDEVKHYLALADSDNPKERLEAMQNLCPCHVRKRIDAAWDAIDRTTKVWDANIGKELMTLTGHEG